MARYRLGDLGFVPRPTWKQKPAQSSPKLPLSRFVIAEVVVHLIITLFLMVDVFHRSHFTLCVVLLMDSCLF